MNDETTDNFAPVVLADLPTTKAAILAVANAARVHGTHAQSGYQIAACAYIQHLAKHKDIRVIREFIAAMPEGMRADSMTKFFDLYAPVRVVTAQDVEIDPSLKAGDIFYNEDKPVLLGVALDKPWWRAKPKSVYIPFDFVSQLEDLYNKAQKRFEKADTTKGDAIFASDLNQLRVLIGNVKVSEERINATTTELPLSKAA